MNTSIGNKVVDQLCKILSLCKRDVAGKVNGWDDFSAASNIPAEKKSEHKTDVVIYMSSGVMYHVWLTEDGYLGTEIDNKGSAYTLDAMPVLNMVNVKKLYKRPDTDALTILAACET